MSSERPAASDLPPSVLPAHLVHDRQLGAQRHVYAVLSRRSRGISLGINLNPDRRCNFHCVYCQVDPADDPSCAEGVDQRLLVAELDATLAAFRNGSLFDHPPLDSVPAELRVLRDLAFSGDGEPTSCPEFLPIVREVVAWKTRNLDDSVRVVLITNGSLLHRPAARQGVEAIRDSGGEVWFKLDAGTEAAYQRIDRSSVPYARILENLRTTAQAGSVVLQSLFLDLDGCPPTESEVDAYLLRLRDLLEHGGQVDRVQVYTVARPPEDARAHPLPTPSLEAIAHRIHQATGLLVEVFPGSPGKDPHDG